MEITKSKCKGCEIFLWPVFCPSSTVKREADHTPGPNCAYAENMVWDWKDDRYGYFFVRRKSNGYQCGAKVGVDFIDTCFDIDLPEEAFIYFIESVELYKKFVAELEEAHAK